MYSVYHTIFRTVLLIVLDLHSLDLAWNYATEAQAYDRVHRLGQHKPVSIQRLIIKNTIEERYPPQTLNTLPGHCAYHCELL